MASCGSVLHPVSFISVKVMPEEAQTCENDTHFLHSEANFALMPMVGSDLRGFDVFIAIHIPMKARDALPNMF